MFTIGAHNTIIGFSKNLTIDSCQFEYFPNSHPQYTLAFSCSDLYYSNLTSGIAPPSSF